MKTYAQHGFSEFVLALGYKGEIIKRFFRDYHAVSTDFTAHLRSGEINNHSKKEIEDWVVHAFDTGQDVMTGGRVKRLEKHLTETFMLTYGDGVSNVDMRKLLAFHRAHGKIATVTAVRPPSRFGGLVFEGDRVAEFTEKPQIGEGWINGGFMVFELSLIHISEPTRPY
mgnify:CR=1 FL=1